MKKIITGLMLLSVNACVYSMNNENNTTQQERAIGAAIMKAMQENGPNVLAKLDKYFTKLAELQAAKNNYQKKAKL